MKKKFLIILFLCVASVMFSQTNGAIEKWENLQPGSHYDYKTYRKELINNSEYIQTKFYGSDYSFYQKEHGDYKYPLYDENMIRVLVTRDETWKGGDIVCVDIYPAEVEENFFKYSRDVIFFGYTSDGKKWLFDNFTGNQYGIYHSTLLEDIDMPKIKYGLMLETEDYDINKFLYFLSHDNGLYSLNLINYELNKIYQFEEEVEFYTVVYGEASRGPEGKSYNYDKVSVYKYHFEEYINTLVSTGVDSFPISYILSPSTIETPSTPDQTWYVLENNQITIKTDIPKYTFK